MSSTRLPIFQVPNRSCRLQDCQYFRYPIVHVVCKTVEDIQNAIRYAQTHNLRVTITSTGHETWGRSSAHGSFSINLMEMKQISVDVATTERSKYGEVTVQTGLKFKEIYAEVNHS